MDRQLLKIHEAKNVGDVHIADDVISIIAGMAAMEVEGISGMVGNFTGDLVELLGRKNLSKGVKVTIVEEGVCIDLAVVLEYGKTVLDVTQLVQQKVRKAVENMTGLQVVEVNIKVAGVSTQA